MCLAFTYIVGFCVHCGLSYISQILSELGTASNLKTVSGFLGCGKSMSMRLALSVTLVLYILFYYLFLIDLTL